MQDLFTSPVISPVTVTRWCKAASGLQALVTSYGARIARPGPGRRPPAAPAAVNTPYYMNNSTPTYTDHCYTGYGPSSYEDLLPTLPTVAGTFGAQTLFGCSPPSTGEIVGPGTVTIDAWFTNTNKKTCTTPWFLLHNSTPTRAGELVAGAGYNGAASFIVPGNTRTPTHFQINATLGSTTTLYPGDQLMAMYNVRTQSGPCSQMTLYYGSATTLTGVSVPGA